jgi:hypothetical protein
MAACDPFGFFKVRFTRFAQVPLVAGARVRARFDAVLVQLLHSDTSGIVGSEFGNTTSIFPLGRAVVAPRRLWVLLL